jgi:hypothetical protein
MIESGGANWRRNMAIAGAERYLWWLETALFLVLYVRMWREGLRTTYRFFSAYLLFRVIRSAVLTLAGPLVANVVGDPAGKLAQTVYGGAWVVTEPLVWLFYILVVLELYGLVLQQYRGIASLGRWVIFAGLGIALIVASLTLSPDFGNGEGAFPILRYVLVIRRGVTSSLLIFLLLISAALALYPISLTRNVIVYSIGYAVYFLGDATMVLFRNVTGVAATGIVNITISSISIACLVVWIRFLNRNGEAIRIAHRPVWGPEQEEHLIGQINAVNSSLLRAARK